MISTELSRSGELHKKSSTLQPIAAQDISVESLVDHLKREQETANTRTSITTFIFSQTAPAPTVTTLKPWLIDEFNVDSAKGMSNILKSGGIDGDPLSIAKFLLEDKRLTKTKIGEYLGGGEALNIEVLKSFVAQIDFTDLEFDEGLRKLLQTFRLPGEAQKIDRVMSEFAKKYCSDNPRVFTNPDTAYVLAYSLIMLNTDSHNPNVKKKMSLQDFVRNNRGIDNKKDLPETLLSKLYLNIVNNEIRMDQNDNSQIIKDICGNIVGKYDNLESPTRRFIKQYAFLQIHDLTKPNAHKSERTAYVFNDLILITKPRAFPLDPQKEAFKNSFNYVEMLIMERSPATAGQHIVELANSTGRLVTMQFATQQDQSEFKKTLSDLIEEIDEIFEEKRKKIRKLTLSKSNAAKYLLEDKYVNECNTKEVQKQNLRTKRSIFQAQSALIMGKKTNVDLGEQRALYAEFGVRINLEWPSLSPDVTETKLLSEDGDEVLKSPDVVKKEFNSADDGQDVDSLIADTKALESAKKRQRRNTITGYSIEAFQKANPARILESLKDEA